MHDRSDKPGQEGQNSLRQDHIRADRAEVGRAAELPEIEAFVAQLTEQERMLVVLQNRLYEGSWQAMIKDLQNRLKGRPYIFKLANRIRDDIERIAKLQEFENSRNLKLSDLVKPPVTP